jgi:DNA-binding MarR family transcriptional regulator
VLVNLKLTGTMNVTAAMELAGVSYRGFYAVLERLKQAGLVDQVKDRDDQRVRNLQLDPSTPIPAAGL